MARVNIYGYLDRRTNSKKNTKARATRRDWWLVPAHVTRGGQIGIKNIYLPEKYVGKRVRFKIEVVDTVHT